MGNHCQVSHSLGTCSCLPSAGASWESLGSSPRLQTLRAGNFSWTLSVIQKDKVHGHNIVGRTLFIVLLHLKQIS